MFMLFIFFLMVVTLLALQAVRSGKHDDRMNPGEDRRGEVLGFSEQRGPEIHGQVKRTSRSANLLSRLIDELGLKWRPDGRASGTVSGMPVSLSVEDGGERQVVTVTFRGPMGLATTQGEVEALGQAEAVERWKALGEWCDLTLENGVATLTLDARIRDPASAIRGLAAIGALDGQSREEQLLALAMRSTDRGLVQRAVRALLGEADPAGRRAVLVDLLSADGPIPRAVALDHVAEHRLDGFDRDVLAGLTASDDVLVASAIRAAGRLGLVEGENGLISALSRDSELALQAAKALALVGTRTAVEPLAALRDALLVSPAVKEAAREAVRQIQARLGSAEEGRLSIPHAAEESGALSLANEGGGLAVVEAAPVRSRSS